MQKKYINLLIGIFVIFCILLVAAHISNQSTNPIKNNNIGISSSSIATGKTYAIRLDMALNDFSEQQVEANGSSYHLLSIPEYGYTNEIGKPQLPAIRKILAVPSLSDISIDISEAKYSILPAKYDIYPVQEPIPACGDYMSNFTKDESCYSTNAFYPDKIVNIANRGVLRDYNVIMLEIFPLQYNPVSKEIRFYSDLVVTLNFKRLPDKRAESPRFDRFYRSVIANYDAARNWPAKIKTSGRIAPLNGGNSSNYDYLIIVNDTFYNSILPLKEWKEDKGLEVKITNTSDIPDINSDGLNDTDVWYYINDSYANWTNLAYVLLVGDVEHIPTHYITQEQPIATDHYYSDLGNITSNESLFSEVFVGRISVKNTSELDVIVDKIIGYEEKPYVEEIGWYKKAMLVSDVNDPPIGFENTSNWTYDFLTSKGYSADKIYKTLGNANQGNISAALNDGRAFANFQAHGGITNWAWSGGGFCDQDVLALMNNRKLPIVLSMSCDTGMFDDASKDCLGETWLKGNTSKYPQVNGAIAFFGSSRPSFWSLNDQLNKGIYKAIFNDNLTHFAQVTNKAKYYMYLLYGSFNETTTYRQFHEYNNLGDPELEFWVINASRECIVGNCPPDSGDWNVTMNTGCIDNTINLSPGADLRILNSTLHLDNATLNLNPTESDNSKIVLDGDLILDGTIEWLD